MKRWMRGSSPRMTPVSWSNDAFVLPGIHQTSFETLRMDHQRDTAWLRHQQAWWLRPDAYRWVRPDAVRFLAPGSAVADAFPALSRKYSPEAKRTL